MLCYAIESVLGQTYTNKELVIVDDNGRQSSCAEHTAELLRAFSDAPIRYIQHETNLGACAARNTGIERSEGKYVAFLDDDDRWLPTFLELLVRALENAKPNTAVAYCAEDTVYLKEESDGSFRRLATVRNVSGYSGDVRARLFNGWCPPSTSLFVIHRGALKSKGGFDDRLQSFQDYDLWLRLSTSYQFVFVSSPLVQKTSHSPAQISRDPESRFAGFVTFFGKWGDEFEKHVGRRVLDQVKERYLSEIEMTRFLNHLHKGENQAAREKLRWLLRSTSVSVKNKTALLGALICGPKFYAAAKMTWLRVVKNNRALP